MYESTSDFLEDLLANSPGSLDQDMFRSLSITLAGQWGQIRMEELLVGDFDWQSMSFARLLLSFGDATVHELAQGANDPTSQKLMKMFHNLLKCEGVAIAEDGVCHQALEFWSTFVEFLTDSLYDDTEKAHPWMPAARAHVIQAVEECWAKIRQPPPEVTATWDSDTRMGFKAFRADVEDLFQALYTLLGVGLFETLSDLTLRSLQSSAWIDLEATLFCLSALSDTTSGLEAGLPGQSAEDQVLYRVFSSPLFDRLSDSSNPIPPKTRHTAVQLVGRYTTFFERHTAILPSVLNFLFTSLKAPELALIASKSITSLCHSCRKSLTNQLNTFIDQYDQFLTWPTADWHTKERLLSAVAAIIQALDSDDAKVEPIMRLIGYVQADLQKTISSVRELNLNDASRSEEVSNTYSECASALTCLSGIGKGLQAPDDVPIDLDNEQPQSPFWTQGQGIRVHWVITETLKAVIDHLGLERDIVSAVGNVLKVGFAERSPGPFVLDPSTTAGFLTRCSPSSPYASSAVTTASAFITSHASDSSPRIDAEANSLLTFVYNVIDHLSYDPSREPELAQACMDFTISLLPRYTNILYHVDAEAPGTLNRLFTFAFACLNGREPLSKRSAASFFRIFVDLTLTDPQLQQVVNETMQNQIGPALASSLVRNIGGDAARSELDMLAEVLRRFVFKQPRAKMWLELALTSEAFPSDKVGVTEKRVWLQKVMK